MVWLKFPIMCKIPLAVLHVFFWEFMKHFITCKPSLSEQFLIVGILSSPVKFYAFICIIFVTCILKLSYCTYFLVHSSYITVVSEQSAMSLSVCLFHAGCICTWYGPCSCLFHHHHCCRDCLDSHLGDHWLESLCFCHFRLILSCVSASNGVTFSVVLRLLLLVPVMLLALNVITLM